MFFMVLGELENDNESKFTRERLANFKLCYRFLLYQFKVAICMVIINEHVSGYSFNIVM